MKRLNLKRPSFKGMIKNIKASLKTRSFRVGGYSIVATVLVAAIVVVVNVLVNALPTKYTQFDTTSSQLYTFSDQTESIVNGLDEEVTIYWIVRSGYEDTTLEKLLDKYDDFSDRIKVVKKDPDVSPTFVRQYFDSSVTDNSMVVESGERYRVVDYSDVYEYDYTNYYYTGSADVSFAGESVITSAIDYAVSVDLPKMYTLSGHGESTLSSDMKTQLEKNNIELEELSLMTVDDVPEDADCILIYGPQSDIGETEKDLLLTWLQNGGKLILLTTPLQSGENLPNLEAVMEYYGVTAAEGIVVEQNRNNYISGINYYLLPNMKYHAITSPLSSNNYYAMLYIAQGLMVSDDLRSGLSVTQLLTTSDSAISKVAGYSLNTYEKEDGDIDGPFALAVAITETVSNGEQTQIVWVGSDSLLDTQIQIGQGNESFFLNCVNWICEKEDSISIVSKSLDYNYLTISSAASSTWTMLVVALIPLAYLSIGVYISIKRRKK